MGRYRSIPDPLATVSEPRWLVVRERASRPVSYRALPSGADLKATLEAERQCLMDEGWRAEPMTRYSFVYCERDDERRCISIECYEPGHAPVGHGAHLGGRAPGK
jgi:hypothetical protein